MAMKPLIVIGCGGSGGKVVVALRNQLEIRLRNSGWTEGIPDAWQLLFVDTPGSQESYPDFGPPVPREDYVSVSQGEPVYKHVDDSLMRFLGRERWRNIGNVGSWRPSPDITLPVDEGAGQWRAVGRVAALSSMRSVSDRVQEATTKISQGAGQFSRLAEHLGDDTGPSEVPFVIVVSSLAGGTGSGIFLDICDVVRATNQELQNRILGVLFTAEIFKDLGELSGLQFNTVGAMSELMSNYLSPQQPFPEIFRGAFSVTGGNQAMKRGVNYPFLVGMKTLQGSDLGSTADAYKSVTETLTSIFLNPSIQQEFTQYLITNWGNEQDNHTTKWDMHDLQAAAFDNQGRGDVEFNGIVSSLGSARLSVGSQMFAEYAAHRLARTSIDFMTNGFLSQGRTALADPGASEEQILRFYRERDGLNFLEACGLRELDSDEKEWNQVIEAILSDEELKNTYVHQVRARVEAELAEYPQRLTTDLMQLIFDAVNQRKEVFLAEVKVRIAQGSAEFMKRAPEALMTEASRVLARDGVQVASTMVQFAREQIEQACAQLERENQTQMQHINNVGSLIAEAFKDVKQSKGGTKLDGSNPVTKNGIKNASNWVYWLGRIAIRKEAIELLKKFDKDVIKPFLKQLQQIADSSDSNSAAVSDWPSPSGVPSRFAPSPLDFCLIDSDSWPELFKELLRETVERDFAGAVDPDEYARGQIGGGGFSSNFRGVATSESASLEIDGQWTEGRPVQFKTNMKVEDYLRRARNWISRTGTPFGDFTDLKLWGYLDPVDQTGNPVVDHPARVAKFKDQFFATLERAQPLIHVNQPVFTSVHTNSTLSGTDTRVRAEKLPFPPNSRAREVAEEVLHRFSSSLDAGGSGLDQFFSDPGKDCEGVLYVSRLKGAIHPSAVASLTSPIATAWQNATSNGLPDPGVWRYRRTRPLTEFIPLRPRVRQDMMKGWIVGRLLGIISKPNENGVMIAHAQSDRNESSRFLWPTLAHSHLPQLHENTKAILPAMLESIGLAYVLHATNSSLLDAYDQLYKLGRDSNLLLEGWLRSGEIKRRTVEQPLISGIDAAQRKISASEKLNSNRNLYAADVNMKIELIEDLRLLPFGFELSPEIVGVIDELLILVNETQSTDTDF